MSDKRIIQHPEYGEIVEITAKTSPYDTEPKTFYKGKRRISQEAFDWSLENEMFDSIITQVCTVCGCENETEPDAHLFYCDGCGMLTVHSGASQLL